MGDDRVCSKEAYTMKRAIVLFMSAAILTVLCGALPASAGDKETAKVEEATTMFNQIQSIPDKAIPDWMLKDAYGIAVIPHVIKAGFVVGGRYGWGLLSVRSSKEGGWSPPIFVTLAGGSFGFQIGVEAVDVVLVFKSSKSINKITSGRFTAGVDAGVSAGPVGRNASAGTEAQLRSEIYSYSRSRGLFAGAVIDGAVIAVDGDADVAFYGEAGDKTANIFDGKVKVPEAAAAFVKELDSAR
jgi:lipid-binding SYLF domain-containing protein